MVLGLAAAGLMVCGSARAQIALQDGGTNLVTGVTTTAITNTNFTVTSGASVLVVSLMDRNNNGGHLSPASLTWSAPGFPDQTLTRVVSVNNGASTWVDSDIYYVFNPNPGTASITATDTSGNTPSGMTMQAFTLNGVDTSVMPTTVVASNTSAASLSVTLPAGTPLFGWAIANSSYANSGNTLNLAASGGTVKYAEANNAVSSAMGWVANLGGGSSTITANSGSTAAKMSLGAAVFAPYLPGASAPITFTATAQQNQVSLSWADSSSGAATSYIVWRSTSSSGGFSAIATNSGNGNISYVDANVANWTPYYYYVQAVGSAGSGSFSAQANATPFGTSAAPTGFAAVGYDTNAALSWNTTAGANTYNVLRSNTSGSGYSQIATGLTSPYFLDTGLTTGTTYYYIVNAQNTYGTSANSSEVSATPEPLPAQNGIITVQDGALTNGIVAVEAGSSPSIQPPTVSKTVTVTPGASVLVVPFYIQYTNAGLASGDLSPATLAWGNQSLIKAVASTNPTAAGIAVIYYLTNPIPGTHSISFTDTTGKPVWELGINAYTLNNVDTTIAPTAMFTWGQFVGTAGLSVSYPSAPFGAFVAAVATSRNGTTRLNSTTGTTNYQVVITPSTPFSTFINENILMGGVHDIPAGPVTVTSSDTGSGTSQVLATAMFSRLVVGPGVPASVSATGQENQIALSWADGGNSTGYVVLRSSTSGSGYVQIATTTSPSYIDTSVTTYVPYYYVIQATNSVGTSSPSPEVSAFALGAPRVPTGLSAVGYDTSAALTWNVESSADSYNVLRSTTSGGPYDLITSGVAGNAPYYTDSGLTTGTTYYYVVQSVNGLGTSADSSEASATPQPMPPPSGEISVQDGSLTAMTNGTGLNLSMPFTVTPGANALIVLVYDRNGLNSDTSPSSLTWRDQTLLKMVSEFDARDTSFTAVYYLPDPTPGSSTITMTDTSGASANSVSMAMQVYTLSGVNNNDVIWPGPQAGGGANDFAQANTGVSATFTSVPAGSFAAVSALGGQNTANTEHIASTNGGTVTFASKVVGGTDDIAMGGVANLPAGTIVISATNSSGGIAGSVAVGVFSPLILGPSAPDNLTAEGQTNQIVLTWEDTSSGSADSYMVFRSTNAANGFTPIWTNAGNANVTFTDTNVLNYQTYYYEIKGVNSGGSSAPSNVANAFAVGVPPTPTGLSGLWGNNQATLTWNAAATATNYNVLRSTTSGSGFTVLASVTTPGYVDTTAVNGTTYYYEVNAVNDVGASPNASPISVTPASAPAQITVLDGSTTTMLDEDVNGTTSISMDFTVSPGATVLIVSLYDQNNGASDLSPATLSWGSQTLIKSVGAYNARALSDCDIYYLYNPAPGTQTITATDTSAGPVYAMAMQAYTLTGVDTNQAVAVYSGSQQFAQTIPLTLSGSTPAGAWAAVNAAAGNNTQGTTTIQSTSGTPSYVDTFNPGVPNFVGQDVVLGGVANLAAGSSVLTATNSAGGISFSFAAAVFAPAGAVQVQSSPTIISPHVDDTGANFVISIATQNAHNYLLLTTTNLSAPIVWTTNSTTAGTGGVITNSVPIDKAQPALFLRYLIQ
jgi:fibronectin type 3 domain-containing protein